MNRATNHIRVVLCSLLLALVCTGCDEPPETPQPKVDIQKSQKELRDEVDKTRREATDRVEQAAVPADAGAPDASE